MMRALVVAASLVLSLAGGSVSTPLPGMRGVILQAWVGNSENRVAKG